MRINLKKRHLVKTYEITLPILAVISVVTLMSLGSNFFRYYLQYKPVFVLNHTVWLIFTADFFVRMRFSDDKKRFITSHLAELIAIIPVLPFILLSKFMVDLNMSSSAKILLECIFIIKFLSYLIRAFVTQRRFIKTNPLHYAAFVTMTALVVAAMLFSNFEGKNYSDSIWWAFTTASTTGFGDIVPVTPEGRLVGMFLMIVGLACISMLTGVIAGRMMHSNDLSKSDNLVVTGIMKDISHFSELSAEQVDDICTVLKALNTKHVKANQKKGRLITEIRKQGDIKKTQRHPKIVRWAIETFVSDPEEDNIIENKLLKNRKKDVRS